MDLSQQPLLSDAQIKQLIAQAVSTNFKPQSSLRYSAFGEQSSSLIGSGTDFADRQPYVRGDDPRFIDWRASARSNTTLIRRYHSELSTPSCIVIDRRASMLFGTQKRLKVTQAIRAGITMGAQFLKSGQQLACLILDQQSYWQAPNNSMTRFSKTMQHAARPFPPSQLSSEQNSSDWANISTCLKAKLNQGSTLVLISDFISSTQNKVADDKALQSLSQYFNLSTICISDTLEHDLPLSGVDLHFNSALKSINSNLEKQPLNQSLSRYQQQQSQRLKQLKGASLFLNSDDDLDAIHHF